MNDSQIHLSNLDKLIQDANDIAGQWNGDEAGLLEERAGIATKIAEKAEEIKDLINHLEIDF